MSEVAGDTTQRLAIMARQIADFFRSYPEERAAQSIAEHINKFWTRRMRDDFLAIPGVREGAVDPLVGKACGKIRPGQKAA